MSKPADILRTIAWKILCSRPFYFLRPIIGLEFGHFKGNFPTPEAAMASVPAFRRSDGDEVQLVKHGVTAFSAVYNFDWPNLFYLQQLIDQHRLHTVTDFGGHVGVKFYAYRDHLALPTDLTWQVVDLPTLCSEGRRLLPLDVTSLNFFERVEDTAPADVLICSGVLQVCTPTLEQIIAALPAKPRMVLLNKVAVSKVKGFFTVENFIKCIPYRVLGPNDLDDIRTRFGYTRLSAWTMPDRDIVVLTPQGAERVNLIGEAWTL
jgi:putative methyltransferase (TIGR04325 family)